MKALKILLVEDNFDNRMLIDLFLKDTPHQITMAENGKQAVDFVRERRFDLILMDIQMPVMDGVTATRMIRNYEKESEHQPVPIIAVTAFTLKEQINECLDAGCNGYITKPLKKDKFLASIEELMKTQ